MRSSLQRVLWLAGVAGAALVLVLLSSSCGSTPNGPPERLSHFELFAGDPRLQEPAAGVLTYALNTPLFSDYAEKLRFVRLPRGEKIRYVEGDTLDFPVGTVIAKTFAYPGAAGASEALRLIETRILRLEAEGWVALPYVWNEEQTEARLALIGAKRSVSLVTPAGMQVTDHDYRVPNQNQCKGCHRRRDRDLLPIGPTAAQLNYEVAELGGKNLLAHWAELGVLEGAPAITEVPRAPVWNDPETGTLEARARTWLDINCAHCHNPQGPARTSSLDLRASHQDRRALGVMKTPVAAGRGSGDLLYSLVPGDPDASILVYRLESTDPGEMMPELGRGLVDEEAVQLIRDWIEAMEVDDKVAARSRAAPGTSGEDLG